MRCPALVCARRAELADGQETLPFFHPGNFRNNWIVKVGLYTASHIGLSPSWSNLIQACACASYVYEVQAKHAQSINVLELYNYIT